MKLLRATVLAVVLLYYWSASGHVECTEPHPQESQPQLLPAQNASPELEPTGGLSPHPSVQETWVAQGLPDELLAELEPVEEELATPTGSSEHDEQHAEVFEMEEPVADEELNLLRQLEPEALPEHPEKSVPQDQYPALPSDLVPLNPAPHTSTTTSQDLSPSSSVPEEDLAEVPVEDPVHVDLTSMDCEAEEVNPYDNSSPPAMEETISNAHVGGTDSSLGPQTGSTTPAPSQPRGNTSHMLKEQGLLSPKPESDSSSTGSKDPEDIPTFDEWKRKMMEEAAKEKIQATHTSSNGASNPVKKVQKNFNNYASVECGAKILGSNPEAKSTSAILMENMDMYMLNPCSNKIWFIIELCEPIQVKQLDIANFELFSSTPKDFLVSISDRYPTNKWLKLGTFHGRDERTVQTFPLDEHLYAKYVKMFTKYIKVELLSHFGSEHFCPLSLIRVFGTSMVEEYEEIADPPERPDDPDDDYDYPRGYVPAEDKSSNNIIGSAKDVILNMVSNIAVNVLGGTPGQEGNFSGQALNVTELSSPTELPTPTPLVPELEAEGAERPDVPAAEEAPPPEPPVPELAEAQLPLVGEAVVTPLHEEEDGLSTVPTVTLMEEEEEEERLEREEQQRDRRQQSPDSCGPSSSCSPSLQEYLQQHCSAMLATSRLHRPPEKPVAPRRALPSGHQQQQLSPSACPAPERPHTPYPHTEDQDQEAVPGQKELDSSLPVVTPHTEEQTDTWGADGGSESPLLEPSQTSIFPPQPSSMYSPAAHPTPAEEIPVAPTKDLSQELPSESQDVSHIMDSVWLAPTASSSIPSVTVEQGWEPPAEQEVNLPDAGAFPPPPILTAPPVAEPQPAPPAEPPEAEVSTLDPAPEQEASGSLPEAKVEDLVLVEELLLSSSNGGDSARPPSSSSQPRSDVHAELHVPAEPTAGNGNAAYGSSQKESVFMRLNNRIKALEMNMSLSGRYLEQLSQRYRKQMEEMQRAFNTTIIKLQNTSRIAEEQDQRQTESIQALQGQLENVTQLVLNLSVRVSLLQSEVSDRQSYLLLCLVLGLLLGLLLCANHCRMSALPSDTDPEPPDSYSFCCPDRPFSPYDETGLKRCASYPLIYSDSLQLPTTQGPESLHTVEPQTFSPANQKSKTKASQQVATLMPTSLSAPELAHGAAACSRSPLTLDPASLPSGPPHPAFRHPPSEGSSEGSSHSDDPSFCGLASACTRLCDGLPPPRGRADKRAFKRRRSKPSCAVVDLMQAPRRDQREAMPVPILQDIMKGNEKLSSGAFGVTAL